MAWIRNPFRSAAPSSEQQQGRVSESHHRILADAERGTTSSDTHSSQHSTASVVRKPTDKFSLHQVLYLTLMHGIGAMVISGGINFLIAYGTLAVVILGVPNRGDHVGDTC